MSQYTYYAKCDSNEVALRLIFKILHHEYVSDPALSFLKERPGSPYQVTFAKTPARKQKTLPKSINDLIYSIDKYQPDALLLIAGLDGEYSHRVVVSMEGRDSNILTISFPFAESAGKGLPLQEYLFLTWLRKSSNGK